jgi:outer membrane protein OmpA-like peptidoglycan-associated protein
MLGHIYFAEGVSAISEQYVLLEDAAQTAGFDEAQFHDTLDKYRQVLNIIGKRMTDHPEAAITLVGCNANTGEEKGAKALSAARAKAVQDYLQTVWNIAPERMSIEARNLPAMPSTSRLEEGRSDNRRVEILTESPEILNLIRSTYYATKIDTSVLALRPVVDSVYGLANWQLSVVNAAGRVAERHGEGAPPEVIVVGLLAQQISELAVGGDLSISMELEDRKGQVLALTAAPVQVDFIQTSQLLAQKQGYSVVEKYALILFDFDSDAIGDRNQFILAEIVARIRELPDATVTIVGHTDNIGKEDYNQKLSERRAKAVYEQLLQVYGEDDTERFSYSGVGAGEPLYDNLSPETRSFNRTVTIALEYLAVE